jgi:branched-chain amino acid transport system ATP-binding protein
MADFFSIRGLTKSFGGVLALSDVSMAVNMGEILGIIGPNGAGKSTLLNVVAGFLTACNRSRDRNGASPGPSSGPRCSRT